MQKQYLGIDIGGTAVKLGIVDESGAILEKAEFPTIVGGEEPVIENVAAGARSFLSAWEGKLLGIGVSATGQIDVESGVVIGVCGSVKNWEGTPLKARLQEEFKLPVTVINDANAVAVAEQKFGSAAGYEDVVVVTVGTGIGGGIVSGGRLLLGSRGIGGEIGHFTIRYDGEPCTCGGRGCLERYASATALVRSVESRPGLRERLGLGEVNGRTIFEKLRDPEVSEIVEGWIGCLAAGLIGLTHIFNPDMIVIGGGISREEERFIVPLREKVLAGVMPRFAERLQLRAASLGNDAGLVGAAAFFMESGNG